MNQRDLELLSSYLDGQLGPSEVTQLESRLKTDPQLASVLTDLRATRSLLRKLPARKAPRNFTLTRKMVGQNPPLPRAYPVFRFATALATLLFIFSFGLNSVSQFTAPRYGMGGGGGGDAGQEVQSYAAPAVAATQAPAATEAPALQAPLAPAPTETVPQDSNSVRTMDTPASKNSPEATSVAGQSAPAGQPPDQFAAQKPAPLISSVWQIGLAIIAMASALLMFLMRQISISRWRK